MNIKQRVDRLEKQRCNDYGALSVLFMLPNETQEEALERWRKDNPGVSGPSKTMRITFVNPEDMNA